MTELWALLPAVQAAVAEAALRRCAEAAAAPGDPRTADQRRADTLLDLLTGDAQRAGSRSGTGAQADYSGGSTTCPCGRQAAGATQILVLAGLSTLLGLDDEPGMLDGYGPLPAQMLREVAATGTWRCAIVDDRHGTLLGLGQATYTANYRPGRPLDRHLAVRDQTCTFPGCCRRAAGCDRDHRRRHPAGVTCECNLGLLCRHHHRLKHEAGFSVHRLDPPTGRPSGSHGADTTRGDSVGGDSAGRAPSVQPPGTLRWTTPAGRSYLRPPTVLRRPGSPGAGTPAGADQGSPS